MPPVSESPNPIGDGDVIIDVGGAVGSAVAFGSHRRKGRRGMPLPISFPPVTPSS